MRTFSAVLLGVSTYVGCMMTGWFNGVFAAFMATIVFVFVSVFKGFKKKNRAPTRITQTPDFLLAK
jgi:hypothetical protein